jgi:hypothetical protein
MIVACAFCGFDFTPAGGDHGCPESKPNPSLVARLREDHCDTVECEHGFTLHRDPCPNIVCLGRDLAAAADRIDCNALPWRVVGRKSDFVLATFATESAARDYARWRNEGRRTWRAEQNLEN